MNIVAILQCRMGSSRLPGKILKKINGSPMLFYTIKRLEQSKLINKIIVATSINKENDAVEYFCKKNNFNYFRGNEDDVLDRYYQCAKKENAEIIIRITGDCPLIDPNVIDKTIKYYLNNKCDIVINTWFKNSYPSGFDVEVFNFNSLQKQWKTEKNIFRREHVMCTITNNNFDVKYFSDLSKEYLQSLNFDINKIHLSVDTKEHFTLINKIICYFNDINFTFYDIMTYINDLHTMN